MVVLVPCPYTAKARDYISHNMCKKHTQINPPLGGEVLLLVSEYSSSDTNRYADSPHPWVGPGPDQHVVIPLNVNEQYVRHKKSKEHTDNGCNLDLTLEGKHDANVICSSKKSPRIGGKVVRKEVRS